MVALGLCMVDNISDTGDSADLMSYPQFGYTYSSTGSSLTSSQLLVPGSTTLSSPLPPSTTCASDAPARPSAMSDPSAASQTVYSSSLSPLVSYPRVAGLPDGMYGTAYAAQGYVPFGGDPSAFYSPLSAEQNTEAWRNLSQQTATWPYDPSVAGYPYSTGYGGLDVRRKNATRESTATLKAWLYEHIKNPYPTKGEKIMLAIITKMTLTQVSTWFANARRRLKKENKMQWSPRNRTGDEDDDRAHSDDEEDGKSGDLKKEGDQSRDDDEDIVVDGGNDTNDSILSGPDLHNVNPEMHMGGPTRPDNGDMPHHQSDMLKRETLGGSYDVGSDVRLHSVTPTGSVSSAAGSPGMREALFTPPNMNPLLAKMQQHQQQQQAQSMHHGSSPLSCSNPPMHGPGTPDSQVKLEHLGSSEKPRIWSLADVATSNNPPPPPDRRSPLSVNSMAKGLVGQGQGGYSSQLSPHSFQPWANGSSYTGTSLATQSGHGLSSAYSYTSMGHHPMSNVGVNQLGVMGGMNPGRNDLGTASSVLGMGALTGSTASTYGSKLSNGYLGDKNDIPQLSGGYSSQSPDDNQTAFKPVTKRL